MTQEEKAKAYDEAKYIMEEYLKSGNAGVIAENTIKKAFPELVEGEDEKIRKFLIKTVSQVPNDSLLWEIIDKSSVLAWLEKQGEQSVEPKWCHHKVNFSGCSEEYRKAYYDGWNNCDMQHSQCMLELDDVIKCLINGMKSIYEENEEATWGTKELYMPVKHIIEILEKLINCSVMWEKNTVNNKPILNHSVLMKSIYGISEGEWNGEEWIQYRWSSKIKDSDVLYWMNLSELEIK